MIPGFLPGLQQPERAFEKGMEYELKTFGNNLQMGMYFSTI
jgi:hypothetical protein